MEGVGSWGVPGVCQGLLEEEVLCGEKAKDRIGWEKELPLGDESLGRSPKAAGENQLETTRNQGCPCSSWGSAAHLFLG